MVGWSSSSTVKEIRRCEIFPQDFSPFLFWYSSSFFFLLLFSFFVIQCHRVNRNTPRIEIFSNNLNCSEQIPAELKVLPKKRFLCTVSPFIDMIHTIRLFSQWKHPTSIIMIKILIMTTLVRWTTLCSTSPTRQPWWLDRSDSPFMRNRSDNHQVDISPLKVYFVNKWHCCFIYLTLLPNIHYHLFDIFTLWKLLKSSFWR